MSRGLIAVSLVPFHRISLAPLAFSPERSGLNAWYRAPTRLCGASQLLASQVLVSKLGSRVTNERMKPSENAPWAESPPRNDADGQTYSPQPLALSSAPKL